MGKLLADNLLSDAEFNEPEITKHLKIIAEKAEAKLTGLKNKLKTEKSLIRKLIDSSLRDISDETLEKKLKKTAESINDVLRYTFIFPIDSYQKGFEQTLDNLRKEGYRIVERRIWNAWKNAGTDRDTGYRGINITIKSSQNQIFELQFHTAESFKLKTKTHKLYEEARQSTTSEKRRNEIIKQVVKLAENIEIPKEYQK